MDIHEGGAVGQAHGLPCFLEVIVEVLAGVGVEGERQVLDHSPTRQLVFDAEETLHPLRLLFCQDDLGRTGRHVGLVMCDLWTHKEKTHMCHSGEMTNDSGRSTTDKSQTLTLMRKAFLEVDFQAPSTSWMEDRSTTKCP